MGACTLHSTQRSIIPTEDILIISTEDNKRKNYIFSSMEKRVTFFWRYNSKILHPLGLTHFSKRFPFSQEKVDFPLGNGVAKLVLSEKYHQKRLKRPDELT
ncbi:hypothetical protein ACJX0J_034919, partial [Zea mays]